MSGHTPGPWHVVEHTDSEVSVYAGKEWITGLSCIGALEELGEDADGSMEGDMLMERMNSNARLIAAAPEILEALRVARKQLETLGGSRRKFPKEGQDEIHAGILETCDAAIAKAEGTS